MFDNTGDVKSVLNQYYNDGTVPDIWYDWFCTDKQLPKRAKRLAQILAYFVAREKMDDAYLANKYVFFKNNAPCVGKLYDQLSICEKGTGKVLYCIQDQINENRGKGVQVFSADFKDFAEPVAVLNV
jgi:hypothetical protein